MTKGKNTLKSGGPHPALVAAVEKILRPLVGLLLEHGLTYSWVTGVLKRIYVDVAEKEFALPDKAQTDSRITLLTGVHRKDVHRLRHEPMQDTAPPSSVYLGAQIVAAWTGDRRYTDRSGHPRVLPRLSRGRSDASFETLVSSVSKDIRPRAVLDEWLRLGVVEVDADDNVRLKEEAFIPAKGFEEKAYYLGRNIQDHLASARHNVQEEGLPFLERSVYYDELTPDSVQALREMSEQEAMNALKKVNARARRFQARDRDAKDADHRMNFGVYFFSEEEDPGSADAGDQD